MKGNTKIGYLAVLLLLCAICSYAQTEIPEKIKDKIASGISALEAAKTPAEIYNAAKSFAEAAIIAPECPDAHYYLGKTLSMIQGNAGKAVKELRKYLALYPDAPDKDKTMSLVSKLEEDIKVRNASTAMGLSLVKLPDGIYIDRISPDFEANIVKFTPKPTSSQGRLSSRFSNVQHVYVGDKILKINDVTISDYTVQEVCGLIERDTSYSIKLSLIRAKEDPNKALIVYTPNINLKKKYSMRDLGEEDLANIIDTVKKPLVVFFESNFCQFCDKYDHFLFMNRKEYNGMAVFIVANVDESIYLADEFDVKKTPVVYMYKDGKLADKLPDYDEEKLKNKIDKLIR